MRLEDDEITKQMRENRLHLANIALILGALYIGTRIIHWLFDSVYEPSTPSLLRKAQPL